MSLNLQEFIDMNLNFATEGTWEQRWSDENDRFNESPFQDIVEDANADIDEFSEDDLDEEKIAFCEAALSHLHEKELAFCRTVAITDAADLILKLEQDPVEEEFSEDDLGEEYAEDDYEDDYEDLVEDDHRNYVPKVKGKWVPKQKHLS
jgi:hypothetical protein